MQAYNDAISEVLVSADWLFGDKIELNSVGKLYVVCALLRNAVTCLYM